MSDRSSGNGQPTAPTPAKKPYTPPVMERWGTLSDLTRSSGQHGADDHAHGGRNNRTGN
jgi:hypothetical protein